MVKFSLIGLQYKPTLQKFNRKFESWHLLQHHLFGIYLKPVFTVALDRAVRNSSRNASPQIPRLILTSSLPYSLSQSSWLISAVSNFVISLITHLKVRNNHRPPGALSILSREAISVSFGKPSRISKHRIITCLVP